MSANAIVLWVPSEPVLLPANAQPSDIVKRAIQLTDRDQRALVQAFESEAYEMAASFVWTRALASLKKQLATLGMEFVGEMLGRIDLNESSNPISDIREDEAILLAEQLGMISATEAMRLRTAMTLVNHFVDPENAFSEQMHREEAVAVVRSCVVNLLANPSSKIQQPFIELRSKLQSETLREDSAEVLDIAKSPYFFIRTTLTVLLTQLKSASGASLEHAAGNINVLLPFMWPHLREKDRWQTGECYGIVQNANRPVASNGLRRALMKVKGFDYVPETLRSETFRAAARTVLNAHFRYNNFYNEPKPMEVLYNLGSSIPGPAVPDCFTAVLCVRLGNQFGVSTAAQPYAEKFLKLFRPAQWDYYLNKLLHADGQILEKLAQEDKPLIRWQEAVEEFKLSSYTLDGRIARLVTAEATARPLIKRVALHLRQRIMQEA